MAKSQRTVVDWNGPMSGFRQMFLAHSGVRAEIAAGEDDTAAGLQLASTAVGTADFQTGHPIAVE